MRAYELMVIFDGDEGDADVQLAVKRVSSLLTDAGVTIATTDFWGRRKFAYEIDHKLEGYYLVLEMTAENGTFIDDVERQLLIADDVVRHMFIRLPDHEADRRGLLGTAS